MRCKGVGPAPCDYFLCAECPGWQEDRVGLPLVGKTGDEVDRLLDACGLPPRSEMFFDNLYRDYRGKDYNYTIEDLKLYEPELLANLKRVRPKVIITLGRHAARYFLGDVDLESVWGIPWISPSDVLEIDDSPPHLIAPDARVIFPIHHPAAGFYSPELSPYIVAGFQQLASFLQGTIGPRLLFDDPVKAPTYEEITTEAQLQSRLQGLQKGAALAIDTEGWPHKPWSLQFSYEPGTAYLIRQSAPNILRRFSDIINRIRPRLVYHSALHDIGMSRAMGLGTEGLAFDDTMVMAYLLQLEGQGLKAGCLRHCGMKMDSYDDIMGDVQNDLARDYLTWIWDAEQVDYEEAQQKEFEARRALGRRIKKLPSLSRTPLHKAVTRVLQSKRPYGLWLEQLDDLQVAAYDRMGPMPQATLDYIDPVKAVHYGCRDADGTARLLPHYGARIDALGLREVYNLELSTYPLIDRMQRIGLKPDLAHFARLSDQLGGELSTLQARLCRETGLQDFNANSGDQVAAYLFETVGLEEIKWTETGNRGSTNDKILEALEHEHPECPIVGTIRTYREVYKLKHAFVDRLPDFVQRWPMDGRIHATFRTTRVVTGRLAASDPNLLAQPEHGQFAPDFKRGWVAEDGHVLCQWDESQIELRGLAHLSNDPVLVQAFTYQCDHHQPCERDPCALKRDIHASLAHRIFGILPSKQDKHKHRFPVKEVNFGIPNGMQAYGLRLALRAKGLSDISEDDAQRWLDETNRLYVGVPVYQARMVAEAERNGFIRCLSGRIRYIGGINSRDERTRAEAGRAAFSTPIQASAADVMKQAEATVWTEVLPYFWKQGKWVEPLLQVHDCLKMECEVGVERELHALMQAAMTEVPHGFSVPLAVEGEFGGNMASEQMDPNQYPEWDNPEGMRGF